MTTTPSTGPGARRRPRTPGVPLLLAGLLALGAGCGQEPGGEAGEGISGDAGGPAGGVRPAGDVTGDAFTFRRITDDVYHAVGTGAMAVGANAAVVINEDDVLLVDSHVSPAAARALLDELEAVTARPVRYVVNTHFHFDHLHGNQIYPSEVEIVGHEFTRRKVVEGGSASGRAYRLFIEGLPDRIGEAEMALDTATDEVRIRELEQEVAYLRGYRDDAAEVEPTPPTATVARRLTLYRGGREVRILFFGRGHTGGDLVVHLPDDGVLVTGDLLTPGLPYMGDGYPRQWAETLGALEALDFRIVLSGHGPAFRERAKIGHLQAYLRDLWTRTEEMHRRGVPVDRAARTIDMRDHSDHYPEITEAGVHPHAVARIYELLEEEDGDEG